MFKVISLVLILTFASGCKEWPVNQEIKNEKDDFKEKKGEINFNFNTKNFSNQELTDSSLYSIVFSANLSNDQENIYRKIIKLNSSKLNSSEYISLPIGQYTLTEFLVLDNTGKAIYALPTSSSTVKSNDTITFSINETENNNLELDVFETENYIPLEFGYNTFYFGTDKKIELLLNVKNNTTRNFLPAEVSILENNNELYSKNITAKTKYVLIDDNYENYELKISSNGFKSQVSYLTNKEIKTYLINALEFELTDVDITKFNTIYQNINQAPIYNDSAINGNYIYFACNNSIKVYNIAIPNQIQYFGSVKLPAGNAVKIKVHNGYAYVAADFGGFQIYDVTIPDSPFYITTVNFTDKQIIDFDFSQNGKYVFVIDRFNQVTSVNINSPTNPVKSDMSSIENGVTLTSISVKNDRAYLAGYGAKNFHIIDVSNPTDLKQLKCTLLKTSNDSDMYVKDIHAEDNYVYLASHQYQYALYVFDITDVNSITMINHVPLDKAPYSFEVTNNNIFLSQASGYILSIDRTNPVNLSEIGSIKTPNIVKGFSIHNNYAYFANNILGFNLYDFNIVNNPSKINTPYFLEYSRGIFVDKGYCYVATETKGVSVFDVSNISNIDNIKEVDSLEANLAEKVFVKNNYAYVADGMSNLIIFDVSNKDQAKEVSRIKLDGYVRDLYVYNNHAYLACEYGGLAIVNIEVPEQAYKVKVVDAGNMNDNPFSVFVKDSYAYLAYKNGGITIVDISVPASAVLIKKYDFGGFISDILVKNNIAYILDFDNGVHIYNISDVKDMVHITSFATNGTPHKIQVCNNKAYIADGEGGLSVYNVSDLDNIIEEKNIATDSEVFDVALKGDKIYICDKEYGFRIIGE